MAIAELRLLTAGAATGAGGFEAIAGALGHEGVFELGAFNPPVIPGSDIHLKSGMPLTLLYVTCAAAPGFVTTAVIKQTRTRRTQQQTHARR